MTSSCHASCSQRATGRGTMRQALFDSKANIENYSIIIRTAMDRHVPQPQFECRAMPSLWTRKKIDSRKILLIDLHKCRQFASTCVCVCECVCVSCSFLQVCHWIVWPASYQHLGKGVRSWYWCCFSLTSSRDLNDCSKSVLYLLQVKVA